MSSSSPANADGRLLGVGYWDRDRRHPSLRGLGGLLKRGLDLLLASLGLLAFLPLFGLIALMIKLDSPGPVIFRQRRVGLYGQEFWMLKFRTMVQDAESLREAMVRKNALVGGEAFKPQADPRVTRIGRWLRRTSLDEFPQLLNVLRGDMSLVGPRPLPLYEYSATEALQRERLDVLPGCSGLWQISGRCRITVMCERFGLDVEYVRRWSLRFDLWILLKTVKVVIRGDGAW